MLTRNENLDGLVKDVPFGILLDVATAKSVVEWLKSQIEITESLQRGELPKTQ